MSHNHQRRIEKQVNELKASSTRKTDSTLRAVSADGVHHTGVRIIDQEKVTVHSPIQPSDVRSYLRTIRSLRRIVPHILFFIEKKIQIGQPVFHNEIYDFIWHKFKINRASNDDLPSFVDRVYIAIFCILNRISLQRFRHAGFHSKWFEKISESDQSLLHKYQKNLKPVPENGQINRYFTSQRLKSPEGEGQEGKPVSKSGWSNERKVAPPSKFGWNTSSKGKPVATSKSAWETSSKGKPAATSKSAWETSSKGKPVATSKSAWETLSKGKPVATSKSAWETSSKGKPAATSKSAHHKQRGWGVVSNASSSWSKVQPSIVEYVERHHLQVEEPSIAEQVSLALKGPRAEKNKASSKVNLDPSFNERLKSHISFIGTSYHTAELPPTWFQSTGGSHVKQVMKDQAIKAAIEFASGKLEQLIEDEFSEQDEEESDSDISDGPFAELKNQSELMTVKQLKKALTVILEENMLWDIGLQMLTLRDQSPDDDMKKLTTRCYCPCGKIHKNWLRNKGITSSVFDDYCHNNKFEDITDFLRHMSGKAIAKEPIHIGLWYYLNYMYRDYTKKVQRKKVRAKALVMLPKVKEHLYHMNMFTVQR